MRLITWNINSVRLRLNTVKKIVKKFQPDVLCLQETKCPDDQFPLKEFENMGFISTKIYGMKGYNGVSISSKLPITSTEKKKFCRKNDARHISAYINCKGRKIKVHNFYVPAGGDEPDTKVNKKFKHKLDFLKEAENWFTKKRAKNKDLIVLVGDLNIAPHELDVWSHKQLRNIVSHTQIEIDKLLKFQNSFKFIDAVRFIHGYDKKLYSWWSYRSKDWKKSNRGRRLDHIWISKKLLPHLKDVSIEEEIRGWKRPSDHVPIIVDLDLS